MATLTVEQQSLTVRLSLLERLGAFKLTDPTVPLASVRLVRVSEQPYSELRGIRAPGTGFPGLIALGTRRYQGGRDFAAVYRNRAAVVVELKDAAYGRFIVSYDDPARAVNELRASIATRTGHVSDAR